MNIPWDRFVDFRDDAIQAIVLLLIIAALGLLVKWWSRERDSISKSIEGVQGQIKQVQATVEKVRDNHMHDLQNAIEGVKADLKEDINAVAARVQSLDEFLRGQR